ncbi:TetR/AcrR family transcriptional regulator [Caulobacter hibisci]|uniref:TetR/AcrR family transcriptional regulator n=1 Tax=Caulobacter hibisci TaxID=2035993 RepID=A0ABS0T3X7_9CAUL|nr:TetR/AcrR family transcriptional regulator [Caulobacter hibisci]MBI1686577.1 TetR/AcrR family transcriptional regulator [Caulobacter hibisci]
MTAPKIRSPRKPKGQGAERREEILDAALALFSEKGLHAVSTRQIAEASGISQPALYAYFATKDDITAELCVRAFATLVERMEEARASFMPTAECFERALRVYVDFGLEKPDAYRVAFMVEKGLDKESVGDRPMMAGIGAFQRFAEIVAEMRDAGLTHDDDVQRMTQTLWAGLHGLVSLLIARADFPWVEREVLIACHIALLRRGTLKDVR